MFRFIQRGRICGQPHSDPFREEESADNHTQIRSEGKNLRTILVRLNQSGRLKVLTTFVRLVQSGIRCGQG